MAYRLDVRFTVTVEEYDETRPEPVTEVRTEPVKAAEEDYNPAPVLSSEQIDLMEEDDSIPVKQDVEVTKYHFPVKGGKVWYLPKAKLQEYQATYQGVDVIEALRKAKMWLVENDQRLKTPRGMGRFLVNWLNKTDAAPSLASKEEFLEF